jgi:hypothetical protein
MPRKRVDEGGDRALEMIKPSVEIGIVALILHNATGMSHGRAVAGEQRPDLS